MSEEEKEETLDVEVHPGWVKVTQRGGYWWATSFGVGNYLQIGRTYKGEEWYVYKSGTFEYVSELQARLLLIQSQMEAIEWLDIQIKRK